MMIYFASFAIAQNSWQEALDHISSTFVFSQSTGRWSDRAASKNNNPSSYKSNSCKPSAPSNWTNSPKQSRWSKNYWKASSQTSETNHAIAVSANQWTKTTATTYLWTISAEDSSAIRLSQWSAIPWLPISSSRRRRQSWTSSRSKEA